MTKHSMIMLILIEKICIFEHLSGYTTNLTWYEVREWKRKCVKHPPLPDQNLAFTLAY
jgi:hypothetical protein